MSRPSFRRYECSESNVGSTVRLCVLHRTLITRLHVFRNGLTSRSDVVEIAEGEWQRVDGEGTVH
jgi:hypothetical protein